MDMKQTNLESNSQDIALFCMSFWGPNWPDYIAEAARVLKPHGHLIVISPTKTHFRDRENREIPVRDSKLVSMAEHSIPVSLF
jgi:ubiquinone/menaquinone biosynthesis C-methylase UbiE